MKLNKTQIKEFCKAVSNAKESKNWMTPIKYNNCYYACNGKILIASTNEAFDELSKEPNSSNLDLLKNFHIDGVNIVTKDLEDYTHIRASIPDIAIKKSGGFPTIVGMNGEFSMNYKWVKLFRTVCKCNNDLVDIYYKNAVREVYFKYGDFAAVIVALRDNIAKPDCEIIDNKKI